MGFRGIFVYIVKPLLLDTIGPKAFVYYSEESLTEWGVIGTDKLSEVSAIPEMSAMKKGA